MIPIEVPSIRYPFTWMDFTLRIGNEDVQLNSIDITSDNEYEPKMNVTSIGNSDLKSGMNSVTGNFTMELPDNIYDQVDEMLTLGSFKIDGTLADSRGRKVTVEMYNCYKTDVSQGMVDDRTVTFESIPFNNKPSIIWGFYGLKDFTYIPSGCEYGLNYYEEEFINNDNQDVLYYAEESSIGNGTFGASVYTALFKDIAFGSNVRFIENTVFFKNEDGDPFASTVYNYSSGIRYHFNLGKDEEYDTYLSGLETRIEGSYLYIIGYELNNGVPGYSLIDYSFVDLGTRVVPIDLSGNTDELTIRFGHSYSLGGRFSTYIDGVRVLDGTVLNFSNLNGTFIDAGFNLGAYDQWSQSVNKVIVVGDFNIGTSCPL